MPLRRRTGRGRAAGPRDQDFLLYKVHQPFELTEPSTPPQLLLGGVDIALPELREGTEDTGAVQPPSP